MYLLLMLFSLMNFSLNGNINVKDAWVRPGGKGMNTALYFVVENKSDKADTLLSVESAIAKHIQMHETYMKGSAMGMREVKEIPINSRTTFELKPGGYHVMVIDLKKTLKKGSSVGFILHFKNAGAVKINAQVRMTAEK